MQQADAVTAKIQVVSFYFSVRLLSFKNLGLHQLPHPASSPTSAARSKSPDIPLISGLCFSTRSLLKAHSDPVCCDTCIQTTNKPEQRNDHCAAGEPYHMPYEKDIPPKHN